MRRRAPQLAPTLPGPTPEGAEAAVRALEEILLPLELGEPEPVQATAEVPREPI